MLLDVVEFSIQIRIGAIDITVGGFAFTEVFSASVERLSERRGLDPLIIGVIGTTLFLYRRLFFFRNNIVVQRNRRRK